MLRLEAAVFFLQMVRCSSVCFDAGCVVPVGRQRKSSVRYERFHSNRLLGRVGEKIDVSLIISRRGSRKEMDAKTWKMILLPCIGVGFV